MITTSPAPSCRSWGATALPCAPGCWRRLTRPRGLTARTRRGWRPSGFVSGGKAVLDLARSGAALAGLVAFHGLFDAPPDGSERMNTAVLALHGWDDPLATPDDVLALSRELSAHCDDWQLLAFGNTGHSFTNPAAQSPDAHMAFCARADRRAFAALERFLAERFAAA